MTDNATILRNYGDLLQSTFNLTRISEDRSRPRKRALECLDTAVMEYIKFSMPTGFKDWTPDTEHLKTLVPGQKIVGFMSSPDRLKLRYRNSRRRYGDDEEDEQDMSWESTSLFRLMRLGLATPMVCASGIHDHNMRSVFAGLFDSFLTPAQDLSASYAVCSFALPDYKQIMASDYVNQFAAGVRAHGLLLQPMDYDGAAVHENLLQKRTEALEVFLKGATSWMLLDLPIGGKDNKAVFTKFPYAFGRPIRAAHRLVTDFLNMSSGTGSRWRYDTPKALFGEPAHPISYSGLHAIRDYTKQTSDSTRTSDRSSDPPDLRSGVIAALLFPGLLVDHGIVAGYVMARAREGNSISDPAKLSIRTVDENLQQTIKDDKLVSCRNLDLVPDPFTGRILMLGSSSGHIGNVSLHALNTAGADEQDVMDSVFGSGYVRCLTSRRIGPQVRAAVHAVLDAHTPEAIAEAYATWRDKLNEVAPVGYYVGKAPVEHLLGGGLVRPAPHQYLEIAQYILKTHELDGNPYATSDMANEWRLRSEISRVYPGMKDRAVRELTVHVINAYKASQETGATLDAIEAGAKDAIVL